ncbi:MAG: DUF4136 domain-containing protein [Rhizobacter sp.]
MKFVPLMVTASLGLGGCAAMHSFDSDVSSYSDWPAGRQPSTYAFERLPSQEARPEIQRMLEDAARPAVEAAGFKAAADLNTADVTVQLGARITGYDGSPFYYPYGWRGGFNWPYHYGYGGHIYYGGGWRYGWPYYYDDHYQREAALLIRDRTTGQPLYEANAVSYGFSSMVETALPAMFTATLREFPKGEAKPHRVSVEVKP